MGPARRRLDPLAPIYPTDAGLDLHALGRDEEAIAEFRIALTLDPNYAFALGNICMSYADTGKLNDAAQVLRDRLLAADGENGANTLGCEAAIVPGRPLHALNSSRTASFSSGLSHTP